MVKEHASITNQPLLKMKIRFKEVKPGDVLGIYIGNEAYAYMRLMYIIPNHTYLCEIFNHISRNIEFSEEILKKPRLMPLVNANWKAYLNKKIWNSEIVHRDEKYQVPVEEIRETRLMNASQAIRFNMEWTPESDQMLILTEDVWDVERHAELSKKYASLDLAANPENLLIEIRNRLHITPEFNYQNYKDRVNMWNWLKENGVYKKLEE